MLKRLGILLVVGLLIGVSMGGVEAAKKSKPQKPAEVRKALPREAVEDSASRLSQEMNTKIADLSAQIEKLKKEKQESKISGVLFFNWSNGLQNSARVNSFDSDRVYFTYKDKLAGNVPLQITFDAGRLDTTAVDTTKKSQNLFDFVKAAYLDLPIPLPPEILLFPWSVTARVGLQPTNWIGWVEGFWGNRYIAKVLTDNESVFTSADFGIGALGKVSLPMLPEIEYHGTVTNGSGFKASESNSQKDLALRLNSDIFQSDPMGTVTVGLFANLKDQLAGDTSGSKRQLGILMGLKNKQLGNVYAEFVYGSGITGYSLGGYYSLMPDVRLLARLDRYDPNRSVASDEIDRLILGAAYDWTKNVKLALDVQNKTSGGVTESVLFAHTVTLF